MAASDPTGFQIPLLTRRFIAGCTVPFLLAALTAHGASAQEAAVHRLRYADLPAGIARHFDSATFDARIDAIEHETAQRERDGEFDHLIYYLLQSQSFTQLPRIEPATSASAPDAVRARMQAFIAALDRPGHDERLRYFAALLPKERRTLAVLQAEHERALQFLRDKEFLAREGVYQMRGHSTDTQIEANYAVWQGLSVWKQLSPDAQIRRVLIVGPGLDFAPRTALFDAFPPQSFQPYAVADALLSLGLSRRPDISIDCADINSRVIDFIQRFPTGDRRLDLYSEAGDPGYNRYFREFGRAVGTGLPAPPVTLPPDYRARTVRVDAEVAKAVHAAKLNVLTQRWRGPYDLIVATNVLLYFNSDELSLALCNLTAMLRPGGILLHNEVRAELDALADAVGLAPVQARTVRVMEGRRAPLFDAFAIYRKE